MDVNEIKNKLQEFIDEGRKLKLTEKQPAKDFCP